MQTFDQVITDLGPGLARIAASYERNAALREELLQEILLAVFKALPQLKDPTKLKAFVFRVAHNCCVDHVVKHAGMPKKDDIPANLRSNEFTPEQHLLGRERTQRLVECVRLLELPYRQVM
ncbi:MAG TPA: sigma-70 family RNA polymerase sigma factor, partial [Steroidobacteraceae bacterium]